MRDLFVAAAGACEALGVWEVSGGADTSDFTGVACWVVVVVAGLCVGG